MNLDNLIQICEEFPSVNHDIKWGNHLCYTIGEKIFIIISLDEDPISASFKVTPEDFEILCDKNGVKQAPHLARNQWVMIEDISEFTTSEWSEFIRNSYKLISAKLSLKKQKELGTNI
ncbi:MAG: MmcQ/YjbR family DNA-binding protein [Flavobacteriaceae bacterium]|nr:MmcQ/YjbR family DNA-binding protein [Flavobacteriaceae bacterium]